jgi:hypothetical protein
MPAMGSRLRCEKDFSKSAFRERNLCKRDLARERLAREEIEAFWETSVRA